MQLLVTGKQLSVQALQLLPPSSLQLSTPETINVGTLSGARSFEFIVNAGGSSTTSSSLLGTLSTMLLEWGGISDNNNYGMYDGEGSGGLDSGVAHTVDTQTHIVVFTTDGTNSYLYVNGALAHTFTSESIWITGSTTLGSTSFSNLPGNILGFAAYNSQLSATEIAAHSAAFVRAVPEPSTTALLGLGGLALILRRRK